MIVKRESYLDQIEEYYQKRLPTNREIRLGNTPKVLLRLGAKDLPLIMRQSNLHKCIRDPKGSRSAHQIDRKIIEQLPQVIEKPVLVIDDPHKPGLLVLTDQTDFHGRGIVVSIHLQTRTERIFSTGRRIYCLFGQTKSQVPASFHRETISRGAGKT
ncbi:MAG: hypothetical protein NC254_14540 [bacterium]|nr:hypothetical protein [bacterium]